MTQAGVSAVAAAISFLVSGACLGIFFATDEEAWGRANDATIALFAALMIPPVIEIRTRYAEVGRPIIGLATLLGIAGLLVVVATSGLTALGKLDWLLSAKIGAFGFGGFLVWMTTACVMILRHGELPDALAWFGLATVGVMALVVAMSIRFVKIHGSFSGEVQPSVAMWVAVGVAFVCVPAWTIWLGLSL